MIWLWSSAKPAALASSVFVDAVYATLLSAQFGDARRACDSSMAAASGELS